MSMFTFCLVRMHTENTSICLNALFGRISCKEPKQYIWLENRTLYISICIFVLTQMLPNAAREMLEWWQKICVYSV